LSSILFITLTTAIVTAEVKGVKSQLLILSLQIMTFSSQYQAMHKTSFFQL